MNFVKGSLITGKNDSTYTATNSNALMVVVDARDSSDYTNNINVFILTSTDAHHVGMTFWVKSDNFKYTTLEEYYTRLPEVTQLTPQKLSGIKRKYGFDKYITEASSVPQATTDFSDIITPEIRAELLEEMKELLRHCGYNPTDKGVNKIIDEWLKNKGWLIRLFMKHPNYNGKFQIVFDHDYDRTIDLNSIHKFADWLLSVKDQFKPQEVKIGKYTFGELEKICHRLYSFIKYFNANDHIFEINRRNKEDYENEYMHFLKLKDKYHTSNIVTEYGKAYNISDYEHSQYISYLDDFFYTDSYLEQNVNSKAARWFSNYTPDAKIKEKQKVSRAINKILTLTGVNKHEDYNKEFAKFADAINPIKVKRHTVLSIHPIDYYTMSFGNSWISCHSIDKKNVRKRENHSRGEHSSGTESYMLDGTSMVFYTVDAEYDGDKLELQDKINRNMFHYYDGNLIQSRVYPQSCDNGCTKLYDDIRNIVQKVVADILEVPNLWNLHRGYSYCKSSSNTYGTHYADYTRFDNCNVSTSKEEKFNFNRVNIGHKPICPCCGRVHTLSGSIECENCYTF